MTKRARGSADRPKGLRVLVLAVLLTALLAAGGFALYRVGMVRLPAASAESLTRVLIVAASPDEDGDVVGQMLVIVDLRESPLGIEAVSPDLRVTIPGTTYTRLGDAYPFGGGSTTAVALGRALGEDRLPYLAMTPEELAAAVDEAGGVTVAVPAPMSVFDGDRLYVLKTGTQSLDSGDLRALLMGAPYLTQGQRDELDASLAEALVRVLAASPEAVGAMDTDLGRDALARLKRTLANNSS